MSTRWFVVGVSGQKTLSLLPFPWTGLTTDSSFTGFLFDFCCDWGLLVWQVVPLLKVHLKPCWLRVRLLCQSDSVRRMFGEDGQ